MKRLLFILILSSVYLVGFANPLSIDNATDDIMDRRAYVAAWKNATMAQVNALLISGVDVNARDGEGNTLLLHALRNSNNLRIIRALVEAGADVRVRNNNDEFPLILAASPADDPDILAYLLETDAVSDINSTNMPRGSVLDAAIIGDNSEAKVEMLLAAGADVNLSDAFGGTPLMTAAFSWKNDVISLLIEAGADVNAQSINGSTPLIAAVRPSLLSDLLPPRPAPSIETVRILLEAGADKRLRDIQGQSAFDHVRSNPNVENRRAFIALLRFRSFNVQQTLLIIITVWLIYHLTLRPHKWQMRFWGRYH
ncbi:MAG: ankyrin repeat domain-containing protein [Deinococcota bacterium]